MGRIFTPWQVEQGLVPALNDFGVFVKLLKHDLEKCEGVIGALTYGSAALGCYTRRSDVDCLIVHNPENEELVIGVLTALYAVAQRMNISLEAIALSSDIAATRMHHIDHGLIDHMLRVVSLNPESVIRANPLFFLSLGGPDLKEDTIDYIRFKLRQLEKFRLEERSVSEPIYYSGLSMATSSVIHIARKMIIYLGGDLTNDSSLNVCEFYPDFVDSELASIFRQLVQVDRQYSEILLQQLERFDCATYEAAVQAIDDSLPAFVKFARINALMLA